MDPLRQIFPRMDSTPSKAPHPASTASRPFHVASQAVNDSTCSPTWANHNNTGHSSSPDDAAHINGTFNADHVCFCLGTSWVPHVRSMHGKPRQRPPRHSSSRVLHASIADHDCHPNRRAKQLIVSESHTSRAVGATLVCNGTPSDTNTSLRRGTSLVSTRPLVFSSQEEIEPWQDRTVQHARVCWDFEASPTRIHLKPYLDNICLTSDATRWNPGVTP